MTDQPTEPTENASELVTYRVASGVAHIELNRPASANTVDLPTARALDNAIEAAEGDDAVASLLVTGAGKRFCTGGDVASFVGAEDRGDYIRSLASGLDDALQRLTALDRPVVAGVQGAVAGAGLAVMLSCDLVVAARSTAFVTAYAGVGLTPDCGLSYLLPRAVGQQRALELLLTGRVLRADEALDWGLVTEVVDDDAYLDRASELAAQLASGPAYALGQARRLSRSAWVSTRAESGADEARTIAAASQHPASQALVAAFLNR